jgi:hypothetical protein
VSATEYGAVSSINNVQAAEIDASTVSPHTACNARNLVVKLDAAITDGTLVFTLRDDTADTTLTCTIDSGLAGPADQECSDIVNAPSIGADSQISMEVTSNSVDGSAPASVNAGYAWECAIP